MIYRVIDLRSDTLDFYQAKSEELLIQRLQSELPKGYSALFSIEKQLEPVEGLDSWRPILEFEVYSDGEIYVDELSEDV